MMPRVLLVEDSPTQAQQLTMLLEEAGFAVRGRFNDQGAYYIEKLICLAPACGGESEIDITGGFVG